MISLNVYVESNKQHPSGVPYGSVTSKDHFDQYCKKDWYIFILVTLQCFQISAHIKCTYIIIV